MKTSQLHRGHGSNSEEGPISGIFSYIYPLFIYHATEDSKVFDTWMLWSSVLSQETLSPTLSSLLKIDLILPNAFKPSLLPPIEVLTIVKIK